MNRLPTARDVRPKSGARIAENSGCARASEVRMLPIALREESRQLFLKASRILADLSVIVPDEVPFMEIGEFPAIEALTFAVCELMDDSRWRPQREQPYKKPAVFHRLGF